MPASYAHYVFGRTVFDALPQALQDRIAPHRALFDIGVHGPDLFFHANPLVKNPISRIGWQMHTMAGETVFRRFAALDKGTDAAFAYLAGFLCHFALDSSCHGYVEQMTALGLGHTQLETQLDRSYLLEDGKDPVSADPVAHVDPCLSHAVVIARFFPQVTVNKVLHTLEQFVFYQHLLLAKTAPKRLALQGAFRLLRAEDTFGGMVMPQQELQACRPAVQRLRQLAAGAVPLAVELIRQYPDCAHRQYRYDFNGQYHSPNED